MGKLFTLGLIPMVGRNFLMTFGYLPTMLGQTYSPMNLLYVLGGILLSHPFEVARVIIQYNGATTKGMFGDFRGVLRGLYASEGIAGLYRGAVPRALYLLPAVITLSAA